MLCQKRCMNQEYSHFFRLPYTTLWTHLLHFSASLEKSQLEPFQPCGDGTELKLCSTPVPHDGSTVVPSSRRCERWRPAGALTWVRVVRADRAQQVLFALVVDLAQQLTLLQDKLVALPQLPVAHAAAEAVEVVDALQGAHHKLCWGDLLHTATALRCKQPEGRESLRIRIQIHT